jgi:hypothetical protein
MPQTDLDPRHAERARAIRYLAKSDQGLIEATKEFSSQQWNFKPAPNRWSASEILEHLAIVGQRVSENLQKMPQAGLAPSGRDFISIDEHIVHSTESIGMKIVAPPIISPTSQWSPHTSLQKLSKNRRSFTEILQSAPDLRRHLIHYPLFGPLDAYQWILVFAAHNVRHTKQILEIKAHSAFPRS